MSIEGIKRLVEIAINEQASDLHLSAGVPPVIRVFGSIRAIDGYDRLMPVQIEEMVMPIIRVS